MSEQWIEAADVADVGEGQMIGIEAGGQPIAIYHLAGGEFFATSNICTHAFALLSDGFLDDEVVECPLHAGQFDVRTGKGLCEPIEEDLQTYPVRLEGSKILVKLG